MVGKTTPARSVPFFWTTIFGKSIRYAGYALEYDDVIIDKPENGFEPDTLNFVAYYAKGERIVSSNQICSQKQFFWTFVSPFLREEYIVVFLICGIDLIIILVRCLLYEQRSCLRSSRWIDEYW